jgi:hypothetical protein
MSGSALLSFIEDRKGIAAWLDEPAPMGSLQFVSPQSSGLVSAVFRDPEDMLSDLQPMFGAEFNQGLADFREQTGLDLIADVAAPLGGEFTLALDGPILPTPSWKLILEVYDQARLEQSIESLVQTANEMIAERLAAHPDPDVTSLQLSHSSGPEGQVSVISSGGLPFEIHHAFADGYLVITPSRALLESALQGRRLGNSITNSAKFNALLPQDGDPHLSILGYQDFGAAFGNVLQTLGGLAGADQLQLDGLATACLLHARASDRSIELAVEAPGAGPGAQLAALLRQAMVTGLQAAAEEGLLPSLNGTMDGTTNTDPDYDRSSRQKSEPRRTPTTY